jgi:hypothetical protein
MARVSFKISVTETAQTRQFALRLPKSAATPSAFACDAVLTAADAADAAERGGLAEMGEEERGGEKWKENPSLFSSSLRKTSAFCGVCGGANELAKSSSN